MIRVKSVASINNSETTHTHINTHADNNNNVNNNNNSDNNDDYNNDKNNTHTTNENSGKNKSRCGSPKLVKPLKNNTNACSSTSSSAFFSSSNSISTSSSSSTFPPYSSTDWPSSHTHSVMACFSHASSLDAFIISAVIPVWNHALVSTYMRV